MADSVYTVVELIGTSPESWEAAASAAVSQASKSLRDLRVAEIVELDMQLEEGIRVFRLSSQGILVQVRDGLTL